MRCERTESVETEPVPVRCEKKKTRDGGHVTEDLRRTPVTHQETVGRRTSHELLLGPCAKAFLSRNSENMSIHASVSPSRRRDARSSYRALTQPPLLRAERELPSGRRLHAHARSPGT